MPSPRSSRRIAAPPDEGAKLHLLAGESIDHFGDRWTQQVLSTFFLGARRFDDIRTQCGVATNILADRLSCSWRGTLQRRACAADPRHHEYVLTPKGMDLYPIILTLMKWGDRWLAGKSRPAPDPALRSLQSRARRGCRMRSMRRADRSHDVSFRRG